MIDSSPESDEDAPPDADQERLAAARKASRALRDLAPLVLFGGCAIGCLYFAHDLVALFHSEDGRIEGQPTPSQLLAVSTLAFYCLGGWVLSACLGGLAAAIDLLVRQGETADRLDARLTHLLERPLSPPPTADDPRRALAEIRRALREHEWGPAEERTQTFLDLYPDHPQGARLADDMAGAKRSAAEDLRVKIDAAREARDAGRVLDLTAALRPLLATEALRALEHDLAPWFMALIQKGLRVVPIQPDVVVLAGRVSEQFDDTKEGASLRAALPTLRRSVGLCPRCGGPYLGLDNACAQCSGNPAPPALEAAPTNPRLEPPAIIPQDPFDDDGLSERPSDELEDFRKFLDPPT